MEISPVAHIKSDFGSKFGVPRQSGLAPLLRAEIIPEKEFSRPEAFRGIDGFSHLWLIWGFSCNAGKWSLTVRPPRLGGNERMGVFSTRSPFRPNALGLSCVKLEEIVENESGIRLIVSGADLVDGTPIYDIKPYVPYADCIADAQGGFASGRPPEKLSVLFADGADEALSEEKAEALREILSLDPRPAYQDDADRIYGFHFDGREIKFKVNGDVLTVVSVQ